MLEKLHDHITSELKTNSTVDTVFILTAILLNLVVLAINSGISSGSSTNYGIMLIFVVLVVIINLTVEIGLIRGRNTKLKLIHGLLKMYKDKQIDRYYDESLLTYYKVRYNLFMVTVLATGLVAVIVPFFMD